MFRDRFGVEAVSRTLRATVSGFMTARGYRATAARAPSARQLRDALLVPEIVRLHEENYGVYGVRKMHARLLRQGWVIGRDQTGRFMKLAGVQGAGRSRKVFSTKSDPAQQRPTDLVQRHFKADAPRRLWVAYITYVAVNHTGRPDGGSRVRR